MGRRDLLTPLRPCPAGRAHAVVKVTCVRFVLCRDAAIEKFRLFSAAFRRSNSRMFARSVSDSYLGSIFAAKV